MTVKYVTGALTLMALLLSLGVSVSQAKPETSPQGVVNINTASKTQLCLLPGIGQSRASRIVSFRALKPFRRVIELARVKGIGMKTVRNLRSYLTVEGPTTLYQRPPRSR